MEERLREGTNPCTVIYSSGYIILESSITISDAEFNTLLHLDNQWMMARGNEAEINHWGMIFSCL